MDHHLQETIDDLLTLLKDIFFYDDIKYFLITTKSISYTIFIF